MIFETDQLKIQHESERVYLIEKRSGRKLLSDYFYGDPLCGLISPNNDWAIIAGEHLTIWKTDNQIEQNETLKWIHDIRLKSENSIEILTDPWSQESAIWKLDIDTLQLSKIRDFRDYFDCEYTDNIDW